MLQDKDWVNVVYTWVNGHPGELWIDQMLPGENLDWYLGIIDHSHIYDYNLLRVVNAKTPECRKRASKVTFGHFEKRPCHEGEGSWAPKGNSH